MANEVWQMVQPNVQEWIGMSANQVGDIRARSVACLRNAQVNGLLEGRRHHGKGKGLVFTAYGESFQRVLITLRILRKHTGLDLPAEVFHYPGEEPEEEVVGMLKELGAKVVVLGNRKIEKEDGLEKNFQIKASAIIESKFREVLYLDADNIPCGTKQDILDLFTSPGYKEYGAFFWPDLWKTSPVNGIWRVLGSQCRDEWEFETGAILIDKSRQLDTLHLSQCMLQDHETYFKFSNGDKDIFRYAFLALRKRWAVPGRQVGLGSIPKNGGGSGIAFAGHTMVQHDHRGVEMFVHANMLKTIGQGGYTADEGTTWGQIMRSKLTSDDGYTTADMLANANVNGTALIASTKPTQTRAALERGLRYRWKSGGSIYNFLIVEWEDPRSDAEKEEVSDLEWESPLELVEWKDLERLRGFEHLYFSEGGEA